MELVTSIEDGNCKVTVENVDVFLDQCRLLSRLPILNIPSRRMASARLLAEALVEISPIYTMILVTDIYQDVSSYRIIDAILRYYQIIVPHPDGVILRCDLADEATDAMTLLLLLYFDFVVYSPGANINMEFSHDGFCLIRANNDKHNAKGIIAICEQVMCSRN